jgi:hypothetical protein
MYLSIANSTPTSKVGLKFPYSPVYTHEWTFKIYLELMGIFVGPSPVVGLEFYGWYSKS